MPNATAAEVEAQAPKRYSDPEWNLRELYRLVRSNADRERDCRCRYGKQEVDVLRPRLTERLVEVLEVLPV